MKNLIRERQGNFTLEDCISIEEIKTDHLRKIEEALCQYKCMVVDEDTSRKIQNGVVLSLETKEDKILLLDSKDNLLAIYERYQKDPDKMKPYKVFRRESSEEIK